MRRHFESIYWSPAAILSRNKLFNFVIGNRGGGKSFACKRHVITRFLKHGEQFVYVRRYKNEFDFIKTYFSDIEEFFPGHTFEVKGGCFIIDNEIAGYYIPLSVSTKYKSSSYPRVTYIIYDEFIVDKGRVGYIKEEVVLFLDLYETIARMRDVRVLFISNAISSINPYFLYFNININSGAKFIVGEETCCEVIYNTEYTDKKKNTRFGKLIADTPYGDYAILNNFYLDDTRFIEKAQGNVVAYLGMNYCGVIYSVYVKESTGMTYITERDIPRSVPVISFFNADHQPNLRLIDSIRTDERVKNIRRLYEYGQVRFETQKARRAFLDCMNIL